MFWGCIVAPGTKPTPFVPPPDGSRLHISQATLGPGAKDGARVALRVLTGEEEAESILLCAFRAGFSETTQLDILLSEYAELSVEGSTAIHVTGYYMPDFGEGGMDDDDDDEEDEEDDDEFGFPVGYDVDADDDDEEDSDEEDSDEDEDGLRPRKKSGVVIKELPAGVGADNDEEDEEDSEDDAPPASAGRGKPNPADHAKNFLPLSGDGKKRPAAAPTAATPPPAKKAAPSPAPAASPAASNKPAAAPAAGATGGKMGSQFSDGPAGTLGSRKFDNGLEIINLAAGKPDGKVALMGKRVQMKYVGRLKSNGKVFDASKGAPFTFRLGIGEVIKGWDIGVKGMRVGDKRKLVIPPDMGYGKKGAPGAIPPNAWLEFDIELVNVLG